MIRYISHIYIVCACVYLSLVYTRTYTRINLHCPIRPHQTQHHPRRAPGQNHLAPAPWWIPIAGGRVCVGAGGPSIPPLIPRGRSRSFPKAPAPNLFCEAGGSPGSDTWCLVEMQIVGGYMEVLAPRSFS